MKIDLHKIHNPKKETFLQIENDGGNESSEIVIFPDLHGIMGLLEDGVDSSQSRDAQLPRIRGRFITGFVAQLCAKGKAG